MYSSTTLTNSRQIKCDIAKSQSNEAGGVKITRGASITTNSGNCLLLNINQYGHKLPNPGFEPINMQVTPNVL